MSSPKIIGIMGVSGSGKSTVLTRLLQISPNIHLIPTVTDRPTRDGEIDREHLFITKDQFGALIGAGELSYFVQPFNLPYRYGVRRRDILPDAASIVILRSMLVDEFTETFPEGILVNIDTPLDIIRKRLVARGDDAGTVCRRLRNYTKESEQGRKRSNHNFNHIVMSTDEIASAILSLLHTLR